MPDPSQALPWTITVIDVPDYTNPARTRTDQLALIRGLHEEVLPKAFAGIGVDLGSCNVEKRGDGANILVPAEVSKNMLITKLPAALVEEMRRHNSVHLPMACITLRIVFHFGEVTVHNGDGVGPELDLACRIAEATEPKEAQNRTGSLLMVIASDTFFTKVISQDPAADPDAFQRTDVEVKKTRTVAWYHATARAAPAALAGETDGVPQIWGNVPPRNRNFTGRQELFDELFRRSREGALGYVTLHGMGGVGKTELATEYIYRRQDQYDIVWWIPATKVAQIRAGLAELAQQLGLTGALREVLESLRLGRPHRRWLLVFDDVEDPKVLNEFIPGNGPGEVLITSRNPGWARWARPLEVPEFTRAESIDLLRQLGLRGDDADASRLAAKLGDLPLALEKAAEWQIATATPVTQYLELFEEKFAAILDTVTNDDVLSVGAAFNVSFDALQERNQAAYQLLQVCAFLAPEPVAKSLFTGLRGARLPAELEAVLHGPIELGRAIFEINRFGLAKVDHGTGTLRMHSVVQQVLRNRMSPEIWLERRGLAHQLLTGADPGNPGHSTTWQAYQDLLPHVDASDLVESGDGWSRQLVVNLIQFLCFRGDRKEAIDRARQARDRWTPRSGEPDAFSMRAATYEGLCLSVLGRLREVAELNRWIPGMHSQVSAENSRETIIVRSLGAADMKTQGTFRELRDMLEPLHTQARERLGDDDFITLQIAHDLAGALRLCGSYRRALALDEHTYLRRAQVLGPDTMDTMNSLHARIVDQRELGQYRLARADQENLVERVQLIADDERADTLLLHKADLAVTRRRDGDPAGAIELSARALTLYTRHYDFNHTNALACKVGHSINLRHTGDLLGARDLGRDALRQYNTVLGEEHPYTAVAAVNLAVTLRMLGDVVEAQNLDSRALELLHATLGADHPYTLVCAINMAGYVSAAGARTDGSEALERARLTLGEDHPITRAAALNLSLDQHSLPGVSRTGCDIDPLPM